jgi:hypothetical protein
METGAGGDESRSAGGWFVRQIIPLDSGIPPVSRVPQFHPPLMFRKHSICRFDCPSAFMIDLFVNFMKNRVFLPLVFLLLAAQDTPPVAITFPAPGEAIRGELTITGTTDAPGFTSSQLDFSYTSNPTNTWFALQTSAQPVTDSPLAVWDTTLITDGDYILRLRVFAQDGSVQEVTIPVKVQNDTPILTPTPAVTSTPNRLEAQLPTPFLVAASPTPTPTARPTPTPLPTNAVSMDQTAIYTSLGRGALVILGLFAFVGIILRFRRY